VATDLDENEVRRIGLDDGLVDVKVCAVNEVWSGLKFVISVKDRAKAWHLARGFQPRRQSSESRRRTALLRGFVLFRSHSQSVMTRHPEERSLDATFLSRALFRRTFSIQKLRLVFDGRPPHLVQPCQKQPFMNTAMRGFQNTKSGLPSSDATFMDHPEMPQRTSMARTRRSVVRACFPGTSAIILERAPLETLST
jgi:hypothetical protein